MSVFTEEAAYYLRLMSMYIDLGTEVVLKVFVHHTPGKDAESFLLSNTSRLQQLKNAKILNEQESDLVLTSTPNPLTFDVSLLITLSINLFSEKQLPSPKKGWSNPPKNSDTSISADLLRLRTVRNLIVGHRAKAQLPEWRFKDEWENVEKIFLRIYRDIAPGEESQLKQRIEYYRLRKLDPSIENKYDSKLHEWQQQISEIQQQVEDAFKTVEDIDKYLKSKSDRYERYIKLLVKGGRFVILALIEDNLKTENKHLRDILKDKEDYVRKCIDNQDHLHILYRSDEGNTTGKIDMSTWDITLLATLLLQVLDSSSLDDEVKQAINNIDTARKNYAEAAVVSLNSDAFAEYSYPLKYSIQFLSRYLDSQKKIECEEILTECQNISKSGDVNQTFFDELKKQSLKIKSIQDIYKDKIKKTKHILQEMITHGIYFKNEHVIDLKMITLGSDEEKKELGENVLTNIWQEALERSGDSTDFDVVKKEVLKILTEIRKHKGVTGVDVKQKCILLGITCTSPRTLLDLLNYFECTEFDQSLRNISNELGYLCNTIFTIQANVTLESLEEISTDKEQQNGNDKGITIPITVTSPAAVVQLRSFFKSEAMVNSTNAIADKLSGYLEETVTLKVSHDMGPLNSLFDELEMEFSSSDSLSDDTENVIVPKHGNGGKTDAKDRISTAELNPLDSSEETSRTSLESCIQQKIDFQKKLVKRYQKYVTKVSSVPLNPNRKQGNVSDVYVPPWMTKRIWSVESNEWEEVNVSMHELFRNKEKPAKYIYVIGEADTGKSMFCKMLVHFWCFAHSYQESSLDESDIVKEMKSFEFLFYVSLRHFSDCVSIENMLEKSYRDPALGDILKNESGKCLIVLDGLDEWKPESKHGSQFLTQGLPGRELDADYTIITTSRQRKFEALQINDCEVDLKIKISGIDENEISNFIEKKVKMLNEIFQQSKNAEKCKTDLKNRRVSDISHNIPLTLQQLICLWFDNKLQEYSKCAIYSNTLALLFEWKTLKTNSKSQECEIVSQERMNDSQLSDYLCDFKALRENIRVIQYLSRLAYETLFDKNKETTLIFSNSAFEHLNIPNDVIKYCFELGILTEEQNVRFPASASQQSLFSFFHKSMQEYLAAVYVASKIKEMLKPWKLFPKEKDDLTKICQTCVGKFFGSCKTVTDILDQSNVFIMLCGLEPKLLTNVSQYIYDVTLVDEMVVEERNKVPEKYYFRHNILIKDIQRCIFKCIEEVMSSAKNVHTPVYIADLYVSRSTDFLRYSQNIILKKVLSIEVDDYVWINMAGNDKETIYLVTKQLTKCDELKAIKCNISDERINKEVTKILDTNISTLEIVCFSYINDKLKPLIVSIIPKMRRLITLQITSFGLGYTPHDVCFLLCTFFNQTTSLQHISLDIGCENNDEHMIDLLKQKQIEHAEFMFSKSPVFICNTENLETFKLNITSDAMMNQVCNSLYKAGKLKHLDLHCDIVKRSCETECGNFSENLIRLLPSLTSLRTLTLWDFTFTDSVIARPCDMKSLKEITLGYVTMSMTSWCKFIDCLPSLPQVVKVTTTFMDIRDEIFGYSLPDLKQVADAQEYVREKTNLYHVICDTFYFQFNTKEV